MRSVIGCLALCALAACGRVASEDDGREVQVGPAGDANDASDASAPDTNAPFHVDWMFSQEFDLVTYGGGFSAFTNDDAGECLPRRHL
jgi:hypothetical protein